MSEEEKIEEMLFGFVSLLVGSIGPNVPDETLKKITTRFQQIGEYLKNRIIELKNNLDQALKDNQMLREELEKLRAGSEGLGVDVEELKKQLETLAEQNKSLEAELKRTSEEKSALQSKVSELEGKIEELMYENDDLRGKLVEAENENENLKKRIAELEAEIEKILEEKKSLASSIEELEPHLRWAANRVRDDINNDLAKIVADIKNTIFELKTLLRAQARAKLERIGSLVNMMHSKVRTKDYGSAILRYIKERLKPQE